jgi:hypothetical protein
MIFTEAIYKVYQFLYLFEYILPEKSIFATLYMRSRKLNVYLNARMAKLVNVAVSEAVENCLLRVRVSLRAHPFLKVESL